MRCYFSVFFISGLKGKADVEIVIGLLNNILNFMIASALFVTLMHFHRPLINLNKTNFSASTPCRI